MVNLSCRLDLTEKHLGDLTGASERVRESLQRNPLSVGKAVPSVSLPPLLVKALS